MGCRFRRDFCDIIQFNGGFSRARTLESVRDDLGGLLALGYRGGAFTVDDNFFVESRGETAAVLPRPSVITVIAPDEPASDAWSTHPPCVGAPHRPTQLHGGPPETCDPEFRPRRVVKVGSDVRRQLAIIDS